MPDSGEFNARRAAAFGDQLGLELRPEPRDIEVLVVEDREKQPHRAAFTEPRPKEVVKPPRKETRRAKHDRPVRSRIDGR